MIGMCWYPWLVPFTCPTFNFEMYCACLPCSGKKNKFCHFVVVVQLVHRLMQADISCTTTARLFFFPLLADYHAYLDDLFCDGCGPSGDPARQPDARAHEEHGQRRPGRHDGQEAADQRQTAAHRAAPASHHLRDTRSENLNFILKIFFLR